MTKFEQELKDHTKELHERSIFKFCIIVTVGTAHKQHHENTIHGKETHPPVKNNKPWVQPKKTFINRKVKQLQKDVNHLKTKGTYLYT